MKLRDAISQYIEWRRVHGAKFETGAITLNLFLRSVNADIDCDAVTRAQICAFLAGDGRLTRNRENKYGALNGFYQFATSRGYASSSPLPDNEPRPPKSARSYIFSRDEIRRMFDAIEFSRRHALQLDADTFRTLLLLLYGTGLRGQEARKLTVADVDLSAAMLTVRNTKFFKNRLVPVGPQLNGALKIYAVKRATRSFPQGRDSAFLANRDGTPLHKDTIQCAFAGLLRTAGIQGTDGTCRPPCLHAFRHTFAVHRLTEWYRKGADVQRLLPYLSTYLGHSELAYTQVYLPMTPELLHEAALRLERYLRGGNDE